MYQQVFELHSEILKALAHPKRLEIIQLLRDQALSVSEIQSMLDLPQANLSQHLQILRESKILSFEKKGKQIFYKIAHKNFITACDLIREYLIEIHQDTPLAKELKTNISDFLPLVTDPICGMRLCPKTASFVHHHNQRDYYFCASGCLEKFKKQLSINP